MRTVYHTKAKAKARDKVIIKVLMLFTSGYCVYTHSALAETKNIVESNPLVIFTSLEIATQKIEAVSESSKLEKLEIRADQYCRAAGFERVYFEDPFAVKTSNVNEVSPAKDLEGALVFDRLVCFRPDAMIPACGNRNRNQAAVLGFQQINHGVANIREAIQTSAPRAPAIDPMPGLRNGATIEFVNRSRKPSGTCTGSLIAEDMILTAAHCFDTLTKAGEGIPTVVNVGSPPEKRRVISYRVHPDYVNPQGGDVHHKLKDVAVIRIAPAPRSAQVLPVIDPKEVNGMEDIQFFGASMGNAMSIEGKGFYKRVINADITEFYHITEKEYLDRIYLPKLARSPRAGDSGGPLYVKKGNQWYIAGVLSGDGEAFEQGARARGGAVEIASAGRYQDWINGSIEELRNPGGELRNPRGEFRNSQAELRNPRNGRPNNGHPNPNVESQPSQFKFQAMSRSDFETYLPHAIEAYTDDLVQYGGQNPDSARNQATREFNGFLHGGVKRPDVFLLHVMNSQGDRIGHVVYKKTGASAYLFDFELKPEFRSKGLGKIAMASLEDKLKHEGVRSVQLQVLKQNVPAVRLYEKLGYEKKTDSTHQQIMEKKFTQDLDRSLNRSLKWVSTDLKTYLPHAIQLYSNDLKKAGISPHLAERWARRAFKDVFPDGTNRLPPNVEVLDFVDDQTGKVLGTFGYKKNTNGAVEVFDFFTNSEDKDLSVRKKAFAFLEKRLAELGAKSMKIFSFHFENVNEFYRDSGYKKIENTELNGAFFEKRLSETSH